MSPRIPTVVAAVALALALSAPAFAEDAASPLPQVAPPQASMPDAPAAAVPPGYRTVLKDEFRGDALDRRWSTISGTWRGRAGTLQSSLPVLLRPVSSLYTPIASTSERPLGLSSAPVPNVAAIAANTPIPNAFRVALALTGRGVSPAAINIGPYLGDDVGSGYRLVYDGEYKSPLKLKSVHGGRVETVAAADVATDLYDGNRHLIVWARDRLGRMTVSVDGQTALEASDHGTSSGFDGFSIVNTGGSWAIDTLSVATPEG